MKNIRMLKSFTSLALAAIFICSPLKAQNPGEDSISAGKTEEKGPDKDKAIKDKTSKDKTSKDKTIKNNPISTASPNPQKVSTGDFLLSFKKKLDRQHAFFSNYTQDSLRIFSLIDSLHMHTAPSAYIKEKKLNTFIADQKDSINHYRVVCDSLIETFIATNYKKKVFENEYDSHETAKNIITQKLNQREKDIKTLSDAIDKIFNEETSAWSGIDKKMIINGAIVLAVIGLIIFWITRTKKQRDKKKSKKKSQFNTVSAKDAASQIVVRRKTTSILRKQSLEDVQDNPEYLQIDTKDFCEDSAVRRIYLKNSCIKDIYNMYADDLRNPSHPNEDGCMVLGRWVHDKETNEYYVSLEEIVYPGDDAVFSEYELNFGAKIKLKVTEKLRQLRKDTDKQYDLTCWVHSHPGLSVFFSNFDANVQMQLKHPTHPHFLTAIVVDILTPHQELGIFTFKKDGTITSRDDLKKMYSLEEFYQWAKESERNSFNKSEYFNMLSKTGMQNDDCHGIYLDNSSIDDIRRIIDDNREGFKAYVYGSHITQGRFTELLVKKVSAEADNSDSELIGMFMIASSYSIPTIQRTISDDLGKIKFAMVYTTNDEALTSIPIAGQTLLTDMAYNGEHKFEDLKIWTRRKR